MQSKNLFLLFSFFTAASMYVEVVVSFLLTFYFLLLSTNVLRFAFDVDRVVTRSYPRHLKILN